MRSLRLAGWRLQSREVVTASSVLLSSAEYSCRFSGDFWLKRRCRKAFYLRDVQASHLWSWTGLRQPELARNSCQPSNLQNRGELSSSSSPAGLRGALTEAWDPRGTERGLRSSRERSWTCFGASSSFPDGCFAPPIFCSGLVSSTLPASLFHGSPHSKFFRRGCVVIYRDRWLGERVSLCLSGGCLIKMHGEELERRLPCILLNNYPHVRPGHSLNFF